MVVIQSLCVAKLRNFSVVLHLLSTVFCRYTVRYVWHPITKNLSWAEVQLKII